MKTIAALVAAVALLGQAAQALTPTDPSIERLTLQGDPSTNTTGTDGVVNVGDDDGTELISPLLPETATSVSLLADSSANSVPWSFKLAAHQSAPGRELVAAPTTRECPAFARTARNVLIAVSSCFTKTTYTQIDEWVKSLKKNDIRYFPDDANAVGYEVRWVHDGCAKPDWSNLELKCDSDGDYVGVISITVYKKAADTVAQFIAGKNLPPPIGYVYNGPTSLKVKNSNTAVVTAASTKVRTSYDGYKVVEWNDVDKGFMCHTDLLENLRKVHCATLPGSKASLFVSGSTRKCFCSCADDSEFVGNECKPKPKDEDCTCLWSTSKTGYTVEVKTSGTVCSVANAGTLPVPIIGDNYVDRFRANNGDLVNPLTSPRITLIKERNAVTLSGHGKRTQDTGVLVSTPYTWKDFQSATNSPVNSLVFDQLGQYKIELQAFDYNSNATCPGCVLVVDSFRPTHHSNYPCPVTSTDTVVEFSSAAVAKYRDAVERFMNYSKHALNDGCSLDSRCDTETKRTKAFVEGAYGSDAKSTTGAMDFFGEKCVKDDLKKKLTGSSILESGEVNRCLTSASGYGVDACVQDVCTRCIDVSTQLKEWWVDYKCGSDVAQATCEGKEDACKFSQCLTVNATSIFTGSAQLKETVRNASLAVLKAKEENKNKTDTAIAFEFQTSTTVHVALVKCTDFNASDPNCVYSTKISDLLDTSVSKVAGGLFSDAEVNEFVSWRYSVDNVNWKPLMTTTLETFTQAAKEIKVEAWSKCGLVNKFSFNVVLHLNNKIEVCDKFPSMWYQTTTPTTVLLDKTSEVCMHPKSDFAEVTFDYKPNIGLRTGTLEMTISGVSCTIKYAGSTGNATIVSVTKAPYEIIKEFAIDGVKFLTTDAVTKVDVACTFTYTRTYDKGTESQVCSRSLLIKDCTPPTITKPCPFQDKCDFSKCANLNDKPDIYQACAGNRVSQTSTGAATITTANATCCASCTGSDYTTLCRPLRASPSGSTSDGLFIGRCDAEKTTTTTTTTGGYTTPSSPYSSYSQYAPLAMLQAAANGSISAPGTASSALLGASALVAVVALVVVARRRARAELAVIEEDAYYPLMG